MNNVSSRNFSPSSNGSSEHGKRNLWQWLVEPVPGITGAGPRRQATLVSTLLLVLLLAISSGPFATFFVLHDPISARILISMAVGVLIAYIFSRTSNYRYAVPVMLIALAVWPILSIALVRDYSPQGLLTTFVFDVLVVMVSSSLASYRTTVFISVANFLGILILPLIIPAIQFGNLVLPIIYNGVVSGLLLVFTRNRNLTEADRLSDVAAVNTILQSSHAALDARTHELALAAEVGRAVSQVRALDVMLKDAVELIRSRFDLYYVQVYLTNPAQTELRLQTGSGQVGAELTLRGHRLPVNTASINGRAAIEKHSVVITDTSSSATFRPNPLLPDTRSEMAVPLLLGEKVVGVLDMQSSQSGSLHEDMLPAFEALAGQLAVAVQNANLLSESEKARLEVESFAHRLTRANWADYMDAIHKPEELGYEFKQNEVTSNTHPEPAKDDALVAPIAVVGEPLGNLVVELEGQAPIARTDELIHTVARQVAQQIENLRLLDSAERYRLETEAAGHRLTTEGWKSFVESKDEKLDYLYDLNEVVHSQTDLDSNDGSLTLPIKVRDTAIGQLALKMDQNDSEALAFANAIAERLGTHIESLRQADQTQSALVKSNLLYESSRHLSQAADLQELLAAVNESLGIPDVNRMLLGTFNYDSNNDFESLDIVANWWNGSGYAPSEIGRHYSKQNLAALPLFFSSTPVISDDTFDDERVKETSLQLVKQQNIRSLIVMPLFLVTRQIGVLFIESELVHAYTQNEIYLVSALAPQIATVLENRRQFNRAQKQAERETLLNTIGQKIRSATSVEAVLQIAARELGHALGASLTVAQLGLKDRE